MTTIEELESRLGQELGVSAWRQLGQADIDGFADVTGDHQFIHVDPARAAAETPFGGTIAHGFLTLSLLSLFGKEATPPIAGRRMGVNYGFEKVRFLSPVRSGARVRGRFVLAGLERRKPDEILLRFGVTVEIEGGAKPALVAQWLTLAILA
jgi:acyl dehydratase